MILLQGTTTVVALGLAIAIAFFGYRLSRFEATIWVLNVALWSFGALLREVAK